MTIDTSDVYIQGKQLNITITQQSELGENKVGPGGISPRKQSVRRSNTSDISKYRKANYLYCFRTFELMDKENSSK